jgi:UPF0271 protein
MGQDAAVMPWISSANIACGFHAGDFATMQTTVALAAKHGVSIGAHVSIPDLQGFGRREMQVSAAEAYALTLYQLGALSGFTRAQSVGLRHVKPHGALYNMAARDTQLAAAIARAVYDFDRQLILVGLAGSALPAAGVQLGLAVAHEAFADRRYNSDGTLVSRREPGAVIEDLDDAVRQAVQIAKSGQVDCIDGTRLTIRADTICVHGDRPDAAIFARRLHEAIAAAGIEITAKTNTHAYRDLSS